MPRSARIVLEGVPHHVVQRGNNRRRLFSYPRDYRYFVKLLASATSTAEVSVHAVCLMPNHTHLLVSPHEETALSAFVQRAAQRYAQFRNKRYDTTGKLFEQRFYSRPIQSEGHLALATAYIDLNPVRAGIATDGSLYRWSTCRLHLGQRCDVPGLRDLWRPSNWYQALGDTADERAIAYDAWVSHCIGRDEWSELRRDPEPPSGSAPFKPNHSRAAG